MAKLVATITAIGAMKDLVAAPAAVKQRAVLEWMQKEVGADLVKLDDFEVDKTFHRQLRDGKALLALAKKLIPAFAYSKKGPANNAQNRLGAVSKAIGLICGPTAVFEKGDLHPLPPLPPLKPDKEKLAKVVNALEQLAGKLKEAEFVKIAAGAADKMKAMVEGAAAAAAGAAAATKPPGPPA